MEDRWDAPSSTPAERLAALRTPSPEQRSTKRGDGPRRLAVSRELILGIVLVLTGGFAVLMFTGRGTPAMVAAPESSVVDSVDERLGIETGEALIPAWVEQGDFPPQIAEGDSVVVVVNPGTSDESGARILPDIARVADVRESASGASGAVITLVAPESMARDIADATSVHLSIVTGAE